jgi:hypothetical protein
VKTGEIHWTEPFFPCSLDTFPACQIEGEMRFLSGKIALFFKWKTCRNDKERVFLLQKEIVLFCILL